MRKHPGQHVVKIIITPTTIIIITITTIHSLQCQLYLRHVLRPRHGVAVCSSCACKGVRKGELGQRSQNVSQSHPSSVSSCFCSPLLDQSPHSNHTVWLYSFLNNPLCVLYIVIFLIFWPPLCVPYSSAPLSILLSLQSSVPLSLSSSMSKWWRTYVWC
jgi:hypothetical protein